MCVEKRNQINEVEPESAVSAHDDNDYTARESRELAARMRPKYPCGNANCRHRGILDGVGKSEDGVKTRRRL